MDSASKVRKASAPPSITIPIVQNGGSTPAQVPTQKWNPSDVVRSHLPPPASLTTSTTTAAAKNENKPIWPPVSTEGGGRRSNNLNDRLKEMNAKATQLITAHKNAQAANQSRSISLGSAPNLGNGFKREKSPTIVEVPPSPVTKDSVDNIFSSNSSPHMSGLLACSTTGSNPMTGSGDSSPCLLSPMPIGELSLLSPSPTSTTTLGLGSNSMMAAFTSPSSLMLSSPARLSASDVVNAVEQAATTTTKSSSVRKTAVSSVLTNLKNGGSSSDHSAAEMMSNSHETAAQHLLGRAVQLQNNGNAVATHQDFQSEVSHQESHHSSSSSELKRSSAGGHHGSHSIAQESHSSSSSSHTMKKSSCTMRSRLTRRSSIISSSELKKTINCKMTMEELEMSLNRFDDLESITPSTDMKSVENALVKYCSVMSSTVAALKRNDSKPDMLCKWLAKLNDMMTRAWQIPAFGHEIGNTLSNILRNNGGLDLLIDHCIADNDNLQFNSSKLLQQCLVTENRGYVVEKGLDKVVAVAKKYTDDIRNVAQTQVGTGILEHLFRHSEVTCSDVIAMGGLDTVVNECRSTDVQTLRQCASALANVAMYGGAENQEAMIQRKVPSWLFPLAFHTDDTIKYFACLAIAVLVANKEIEAAVQRSGTLELIEPFVQSHTPAEFAIISATHSHGQSPNWLKRLIPVLNSHREEARNLAAFHFCMEAEIKKQQGNTELLLEIGCAESLRKLASGPNGIAAKYAAQTLRLIGEEVPHKLSQQVPTWSVQDVKEWVKQIGFAQFADSFDESRVDGDLLLQLSEDMLRDDIGMKNGILRRRFHRELTNLKRMADYSSCDKKNLNGFLTSMGQEFSVYTYDMLKAGIDRDTLMSINEEQLLAECGITNKIHRLKILQGVKVERGEVSFSEDCSSLDKCLDVFISYRRSNGSQLASLLKVHLEIRNLSVFLDVDRLEAGKFDNNLLQSIRSARNFVLVLTPEALDRCMGDDEQRDWIHKEVACALASQCNIIPVFDNFVMPADESLPVTMRALTSYNGVKWIHDYQDACVDKIDRFIRGDAAIANPMMDRFLSGGSQSGTSSVASYNRQNTYQRTISDDSAKAASSSSSADETHNTISSEKE